MGRKKKDKEITASELSMIMDWRSKGMTYGDIAFLVKKKFNKNMTEAGIKLLLDRWQVLPIKNEK